MGSDEDEEEVMRGARINGEGDRGERGGAGKGVEGGGVEG